MVYKRNKILAILLTAMMVISMIPFTTAFAEVSDPNSAITVYATVSNSGEIVVDKNNKPVAQVPVEVTDLDNDGNFNIDEALFALHESYYTGGAADGYTSEEGQYGLGITKLWGDTSSCYGYWVNNESANSLADTLSDGDYITASIYFDKTGWSDSFSYFDAYTKTIKVDEQIPLTLKSMSYDDSFNPVFLNCTDASIYQIGDNTTTLAVTDENGNANISFPEAGVYLISASCETTQIIPPVCKVYVYDAGAPHVTVRIEGNGLGTDGTNENIGTVLKNCIVNLDSLQSNYMAIDAVNYALSMNGLETAEGSGGFYTTFGNVSGTSSASWMIMVEDSLANTGLDTLTIADGDDIVLALANYDSDLGTYTTGYSYFSVLRSESSINYNYPYGEVALKLNNKINSGWKEDFTPLWDISAVTGTAISINGAPAYSPDNSLAVTDNQNGIATITLWGNDEPGTYYFDISATVDGSTRPYCRAKMIYDGENAPIITLSAPPAADTTLSELSLTFNDSTPINGMPYLGFSGIAVNNAVQSLRLTAMASDPANASITAAYKGVADTEEMNYALGESVELDEGKNTFKITVQNGFDSQAHTLIITREPLIERNIPAEVSAVIDGVKTITGGSPYTDWLLAMNAAGLTPTPEQLQTFLGAALHNINNFADNKEGSVGSMAKIALALTSLGIDVRQIPDPDDDSVINLIDEISSFSGYVDPVYDAPLILSLYDLGNYNTPNESEATTKITRGELIETMLNSKGNWNKYGGYDGTGLVLPSLAPYYNASGEVNGISIETCQTITGTINSEVGILSNAQVIDGGFGSPNSNSIATIITGLNAIGIDSHTDTRFIKDGSSLITNLLSFKTTDNKLGFKDNTTADTYACLQGFQALATYQNLSNAQSSNLYQFNKEIAPYTKWPNAKLLTSIAVTTPPAKAEYSYEAGQTNALVNTDGIVITATYNGDSNNKQTIDVADCQISTIDRSVPGTKSVTVSYEGMTAVFMVTVLDENSSIPKESKVSVTVRTNNDTIAKGSLVIENSNTSVLEALKMVLDSADVAYVIKGNTYVASINGIGEFDQGGNSGWLYSVNGETPSTTGSANYKLKDGDRVVWYYTLDFTKDPSSSTWVGQQVQDTSTIEAKVDSTGKAVATITQEDFSKLINKNADSLNITSNLASLTFDNAALKTISKAGSGDVKITISKVDPSKLSDELQAEIGDRPVYDFTVSVGAKTISEFNGIVQVSIPYTPASNEDVNALVIYYIDENGKLEMVKNCKYDETNKQLIFGTNHFSEYVIGYNEIEFNDTKGHWSEANISYLASRGIIKGKAAGQFMPNDNITRAEFVTILGNKLGADFSKNSASSFNDVRERDWFAGAVSWAVDNKIVTGYEGKFRPNDKISRQEMAVILDRYMTNVDKASAKAADNAEAIKFTDENKIANYAKESVAKMQKLGIINGKTSATFAPSDNATRAEAAKMITVLMKKAI